VFIVFDPHMREGPGGEPARARNSDIVEDLGMVEYVFSDKTGTLTSNEMQLRMLAVKGQPFGRPDFRFVAAHPLLGSAAYICSSCPAADPLLYISPVCEHGCWV